MFEFSSLTMRYSLSTRTLAMETFIKCQMNFDRFVTIWASESDLPPPSRSTLYRLVTRFRTTGAIKDKEKCGRKKLRDENLIATVGAFFHLNSDASINTFIKEFGDVVSRTTVWRILRQDLKWKPFRPRRIHRLLHGDDVKRYWCMDALLSRLKDDPTFISNIIWSDECAFKLNGTIATNNVVHWSATNPHYTFERSTNRTGVMVFAAISVIGVICVGFFDDMETNRMRKKKHSVNKGSYKEMLEKNLIPELDSLFPISTERDQLVFMQDGASPHNIPEVLNTYFPDRWLGNANHKAPLLWPSRSPDLTPMGYFVCKFIYFFFKFFF